MWGYIIWALILIVIVLMLVRLRSQFSVYVCPKCGHEFTLTSVKEFIYPQILYRKITRCPNCKKLIAAGIIRNEEAVSRLEAQQKKESEATEKRKTKKKITKK